MPTSVFRVLYRQLLRLARQHDRHPALKGMLEHPRRQWFLQSAASGAVGRGAAQPLRVLPSPSGSGIILTGSLRSLQGPQLETILRKLVRGESVEGEQGEGEGEGSDAAGGEGGQADTVDQAWARTVSPAQARWIRDFFREADYYLPTALMESIVRREFRMPLPDASSPSATATGSSAPGQQRQHSAGSAAAAAASSSAQPAHPTRSAHTTAAAGRHRSSHGHTAHHPVDPRTQLTTEAFGVLRTLNKNAADGAARKLLLSDEDVAVDPAFADPATAPRDQSDPSSPVSASMLMRPTRTVTPGCFLVSHPHMDSGPFDRTVILLYRVSREDGSAGVVLNRPYRATPTTIGEKMKRLRSGDPMRLLRPCALQDGGPVVFGGLYRGGSSDGVVNDLGAMTLLHRHPLLASLSESVIGGDYPVWRLPVEAMPQAAAVLAGHMRFMESASTTGDTSSSASASVVDGAAAASSPAAPSTPLADDSPFSPSDMIAYAGRAEWFPGQLENEMERGSWLLVEGSGAHVFMSDPVAEAAAAERKEAEAKRKRKKAAPATAAASTSTSSSGSSVDSESGDASAGEAAAPSSAGLISALNGVLVPRRPLRPFPLPHLWSHAMHVHGGELRHWAYWTNKEEQADKNALLNELLSGRE